MALPQAVVKASQDADRAHKEAYPDRAESESGENADAGTPVQPAASETKPDEAQPTATPESGAEAQGNQTGDTAAGPSAEQTPQQQGDDTSEQSYKQAYQTLKGKYDAEVPRLMRQVHDLEGELQRTQSILSSLGDVDASSQSTDNIVSNVESALSKEEVDEYGEDLINVVKKAARDEFQPLVNRLESENKQLREKLGDVSETSKKSAYDTMMKQLTDEVPDWQEINTDQKFLDWLAGTDLLSGQVRHNLLTEAFENNNAGRVIQFFKTFKGEQTTNSAEGNTDDKAQANAENENTQPQVDMDTLVAPSKPSGSEVTVGAQDGKGKLYTQAEITQFYKDVRMGKYRNNESEKNRIEEDIIAATSEGRITA